MDITHTSAPTHGVGTRSALDRERRSAIASAALTQWATCISAAVRLRGQQADWPDSHLTRNNTASQASWADAVPVQQQDLTCRSEADALIVTSLTLPPP
eukprot:gene10269-2418_t